MTLQPAYGRDYRSKKAVVEAFEAGKDFQIASLGPDIGRYVTRDELVSAHVTGSVTIRYDRNRKVCVVRYGK
jgi:hypothetical protein